MAEPAHGTSVTAEILAALPQAVDPLALSLNESPFAPLPGVRSALIHCLDTANRYPEFLPEQLRRLIADRVGVREDQVVLGTGVSGVVMQVLHAVTRPGHRIVMSTPTFDGYPIFTRMAKLAPITVPLNKYGHHDLAAMAEAAADASVVVLCRPHNPTGTLESRAAVEGFLRQIPRDAIVLLDEAYIEFVASRYRIDGPELIRRFPNVVVLRTFSKAYGLAGLRIGYGFAAPELAKTAVDDAIAVRHEQHQCHSGRRLLRRRSPASASYSAHRRRAQPSASAPDGDGRVQHGLARQLRLPPGRAPAVERGVRRRRAAGALLSRWRREDHRRRPAVDAGSAVRGRKVARLGLLTAPCGRFLVKKGVAPSGERGKPDKRDPIAVARANWERAGWGDVAEGMVAVTSVMRAHQILLARVENALRPYDLSFSRFELLRLLAFSRSGALPITKASDRLQVHVTSVTHAIRRLEANGLVQRIPHPTDGRTTLVQITDLGRSTVEDATVTLNEQVFADIGLSERESQALASSIETLRRGAGDF